MLYKRAVKRQDYMLDNGSPIHSLSKNNLHSADWSLEHISNGTTLFKSYVYHSCHNYLMTPMKKVHMEVGRREEMIQGRVDGDVFW